MKKITQEDLNKAWGKVWEDRDKAWKAWDKGLEKAWKDWKEARKLEEKFKEQEDLE